MSHASVSKNRKKVSESGASLSSLDSSNLTTEQPRHSNASDAIPERSVKSLEADLKRRQESYIRRERQYKARIEELENAVRQKREDKTNSGTRDSKMEEIRKMHQAIQSSVTNVQERTSKVLQEQEKDLLRAFRARLYDIQTELDKEKNKTDDGASAWIEKSKQLEAEVDWSKEMTDRLDRLNQSLTRENSRLKNQFKSQENDREFLVQQLVAVKKDNARLRSEYEAIKASNDQLNEAAESPDTSRATAVPLNRPQTSSASANTLSCSISSPLFRPSTASASTPEADNRYKEIIKRLKRLLEVERKNLRQIRESYSEDMQQRTELEVFLRKCIDDVKTELAARNKRNPKKKFENSDIDVKEFSADERKRVMELLLSQERVIELLYAKTFPVGPKEQQQNHHHRSSDALTEKSRASISQNIITS